MDNDTQQASRQTDVSAKPMKGMPAASKPIDPDETIDPYSTVILDPNADPHATISETKKPKG